MRDAGNLDSPTSKKGPIFQKLYRYRVITTTQRITKLIFRVNVPSNRITTCINHRTGKEGRQYPISTRRVKHVYTNISTWDSAGSLETPETPESLTPTGK
jgi:hypothetical protein